MPSERLQYIDIAKGVAIISIVLLHFSTGFIPIDVNVFIGSYMISMFYVTSGWVNALQMHQLPFKAFLYKRWYQLGVPYIAWTLIILTFDVILWIFDYYNLFFVARELYKSVILRGIGTLWFLPALFGGELLWWWARHSYPRLKCVIITFVVCAIIACYGSIVGPRNTLQASFVEAPLRVILNVSNAWIGIMVGFCFHRYVFCWIRNRHKIVVLIIGLLIVLAGWYCAFWPPFPRIWTLGAPVLAPIGLILIIMALETSPVWFYFKYWGRNSMALMVTHFSILIVLCDITVRLVCGHPMDGGWIALALFGVTMISEYFITEWLKKRFPLILGMKSLSQPNNRHTTGDR